MAQLTHEDIQSFLNYLRYEKRFSAHTILSYETDLIAFYAFLEKQYGISRLDDISYVFIRSWLAGLKENKMTSKTINRKISTLRSYFKYHLKRGAIKVLPTASIIAPKVSKRLPVFVNERETNNMLGALQAGTEDWKSLNAKMIISMFYATGMRLSELISLKEKQIDFSRKQVRVLGKGNKERIIPLSEDQLKEIRSYTELKRKTFGKEEDILLVTQKGKKLYPKYAWLLVNKYLGDASTLDKKSPHVLRHTFATHLMNNGAELNAVKELLGHASLAATQIYTHNTIEKLKDVYKKAHPRS